MADRPGLVKGNFTRILLIVEATVTLVGFWVMREVELNSRDAGLIQDYCGFIKN